MTDNNSVPPSNVQISFSNDAGNSGVQAGSINSLVVNNLSPQKEASDRALIHDYCSWLRQSCNKLIFGDPHGNRPGREPMRLAEVFTMLHVNTGETVIDALSRIWAKIYIDENEAKKAREFLINSGAKLLEAQKASHALVVLLGEPGGGKSTVLSFLALVLAEAYKENPDSPLQIGRMWSSDSLIPIRVQLKKIVNSIWEGVPELNYFSSDSNDRRTITVLLEEKLRNGECLLLFDGLDEVITEERIVAVQNVIADCRERFNRSRIVITCRVFDYQNESSRQLVGAVEFILQRFDLEARQLFVDRWYDELLYTHPDIWSKEEVNRKQRELKKALRDKKELIDISGLPILLSLISLVHTRDGDLPPARTLLYQRCIKTLLWDWRPEERGFILEEQRLLKLAADLGYKAHCEEQEQGKEFRGITEDTVRSAAREFYRCRTEGQEAKRRAREQEHEAVRRLLNSNGLLLDNGGERYDFAHRSFQHFLAGQYLGTGSRRAAAIKYADDPHWRIALHLMAGFEAREGNRDYVLSLIEQLVDSDHQKLIIAAEMLDEIGQQVLVDNGYEYVLEEGGVWGKASEKLSNIAFSLDSPEQDPIIRNRAAELLDSISSDKRKELIPGCQEYWTAKITPGPFIMGGEYSSFPWFIGNAYSLAKFPVTNRQYNQFLESFSKDEAAKRVPKSWQDGRYPKGQGNHPVTGLGWHRATEFAKWLEHNLRLEDLLNHNEFIRLPTEAEWERAAAYPTVIQSTTTNSERREFPWGNWASSEIMANTQESGIGGTSVVGIFAKGAADCGAEDMSGNVWEWCCTFYQQFPFTVEVVADEASEDLLIRSRNCVRRGGNWGYNFILSHCSSRKGDLGGSYEAIGFRLAKVEITPS